MAWTINYSENAVKQLKKLNRSVAKKLLDYMDHKIINLDEPRKIGKALSHNKSGLWRYRVGDYRIICQIKDEIVTILVLEIGHRKDIYD